MSAKPQSLKSRAESLKRLQLHDLESMQTSFVWVLNRTNPRGNLNLTVADGMGNQVPVRIPIANIPVDLSTQATKQSLVANPQVRQLVAKGIISLVDPEAAREFLKDPEARAEHQRIYAVAEIAEIGDSEMNAELQSVQVEESGELSAFVIQLTLSGDMNEDEVLSELRAREDEMTKEDFLYVTQNSKHEKVKAWAAERAV